jgi:hypothetical protein
LATLYRLVGAAQLRLQFKRLPSRRRRASRGLGSPFISAGGLHVYRWLFRNIFIKTSTAKIHSGVYSMVISTKQFDESANRELERRVIATLTARNFPGLRRLTVNADGGTVTIAGRVRTFYEKQLAQHLARHVAGVIRLRDDILVAEPPRPAAGWRWAVSPAVSALLSQHRFSSATRKE